MLEGIFGLGDASYDAAQNKDVARTFQAIPYAAVNPYTAECEYFADCILAGRLPAINNGANALHILSLTEKAYGSGKNQAILTV